MAVREISNTGIHDYIWDTADTKPTFATHGTNPGSTGRDRETGIKYITYDGTLWVEDDTIVRLETSPTIDIGDVTLLAGTALAGKFGIDQATANANEVVLKAGTALAGKVGIDQATANANEVVLKASTARIGTVSGILNEISVTKVLDALTAYVANDVLSESTTDTVGTAWTFAAIARANGTYGYITKAQIISESENVVPRLTLFLFNAAPTNCELDDNAANTAPDAGDLAKYVGKIDFPALESLGTTDSVAIATPSTYGNLPLAFKCASDADDLYGVLVTRDAFTQTATDDLTIRLTCEQY